MSNLAANQIGKRNSRRREKVICNLECGAANVQAHIIDRQISDNGKRQITAYLISAETGKRLPDAANHTHLYDSRIKNPAAERRSFANHLGSEYQKKNRAVKMQKKPKNAFESEILYQAYAAYLQKYGCDMDSDQRFLIQYRDSWSPDNTHRAITYFERNVLPVLSHLLEEKGTITDSDIEALLESLVQKAIESKKSSGQAKIVHGSVKRELWSALVIYREIRQSLPEFELPEVHYQAGKAPKRASGREQIKCLTDSVRVQIAELLLDRLPPIGPAYGLALMFFGGLRTAEASAPLFGEIILDGDHAIYTVRTQVRGRERDSILKTDAAYRTVVLPYIFVKFYEKAFAHLRSLGYSDDAIREMPFVTDGVSLEQPIYPPALSEYIRKVLSCCGCSTEFIEGQRSFMEREPDYDANGHISRDLSAYVFRRDYATRLANCCGVSVETLDYLLGHRRKENVVRNFESPDRQAEIAAMLERFVFLPEINRNPAYVPIIVSEGRAMSIPEPYRKLAIVPKPNNSARFSLTAQSNEPGASMEIHIPKGVLIENLGLRFIKDTPRKRKQRPVLGGSPIDYRTAIQKARLLDIAAITEEKHETTKN